MAIYKRGQGFETGKIGNKSSEWPKRDSNPGPPDCKSDAMTTSNACWFLFAPTFLITIDHFSVIDGSEAEGDLDFIQTFLPYYVNQVILMLTSIFQERFP